MTRRVAMFFAGGLCAVAFVLAAPAIAGYVSIDMHVPEAGDAGCPSGVCINTVTCSSAINTGWIATNGFDSLKFKFALTDADNSVTAVTVTCETSESKATAAGSGYDICARVSMDANATSVVACPHTWSFANAEADTASFTVDNLNDSYLGCTFTCTGTPAAADKIYAEVMRRSP